MIIKLMVFSLLALTTFNAIAGNLYVYKDKNGRTLLTNTIPNSNVDDYNKHVKVTFYKSSEKIYNPEVKYSANEKNEGNQDTYIQPYALSNSDNTKSALKFEVPDGYRLPVNADNFGDWKIFNAPNHLKADFNGDGVKDEAYILPKKDSKLGYGVFVSLNKANAGTQSGRKFQIFKLTAREDMQPQSFAIELLKPSNEVWETACGKGYWECEIGEPAEVKITKPSIMFCYIESSCTMFLWDTEKLSFKEIQFSD